MAKKQIEQSAMTAQSAVLSGKRHPGAAWLVTLASSRGDQLSILTDRETAHRLMQPDTVVVVNATVEPW